MESGAQESDSSNEIERIDKVVLSGQPEMNFLSNQPSIDLADLKKGDVVWWKTRNGGVYYMKIEVPYEKDSTGHFIKDGTGIGHIRGTRSDGRLIDEGNSGIHGSSVVGPIKIRHVVKDASVEFITFPKEKNGFGKTTATSPVDSMGIIRAKQYQKS